MSPKKKVAATFRFSFTGVTVVKTSESNACSLCYPHLWTAQHAGEGNEGQPGRNSIGQTQGLTDLTEMPQNPALICVGFWCIWAPPPSWVVLKQTPQNQFQDWEQPDVQFILEFQGHVMCPIEFNQVVSSSSCGWRCSRKWKHHRIARESSYNSKPINQTNSAFGIAAPHLQIFSTLETTRQRIKNNTEMTWCIITIPTTSFKEWTQNLKIS